MAEVPLTFPIGITDGASISIIKSISSVDSFDNYIKSKHFDHEDGRRSYYPEFYSHGAKIERGRFSALRTENPRMKYNMRGYPPPPSSVYDSVAISPGESFAQPGTRTTMSKALDGSIMDTKSEGNLPDLSDSYKIVNGSSTYKNEEHLATGITIASTISSSRLSGHSLAQNIDFYRISRRKLWGEDTDVFGVENVYGPDEMREDFIKNIDAGAALEFCKVCGESHIPPGPPFTLQDRDTCGSYIPEWFPKNPGERSWDLYMDLINEVSEMQQIIDGALSKDQEQWILNYHDGAHHPVYILGKRPRSGWWKCGVVGEIECHHCGDVEDSRSPSTASKIPKYTRAYALSRLETLQSFIDRNIQRVGVEDRCIAKRAQKRAGA